jgi:hypothetical protein
MTMRTKEESTEELGRTATPARAVDDDPNNTKVRADGNSSLPQITTTCLPAHQLDLRKLLVVQSI